MPQLDKNQILKKALVYNRPNNASKLHCTQQGPSNLISTQGCIMTKKMYSIRSEAAAVSAVAGDWMCHEATLVRGENAWKNAMSSFITIRLPRCSTIQLCKQQVLTYSSSYRYIFQMLNGAMASIAMLGRDLVHYDSNSSRQHSTIYTKDEEAFFSRKYITKYYSGANGAQRYYRRTEKKTRKCVE